MQKNLFANLAILVLIAVVLSTVGCSTDLDVNAPYKEFTVVYGVFDKDETIHLVKINKSFLGEGNAFDMAQVRDSSEYTNDELDAFVHKMQGGSIVESYPLNDTTIIDRIPGTFYYPEQTLYTFSAVIDPSAEYRVEARVRDQVYTATTNIVNDFQVNQSTSNPNVKLSFYNNNTGSYQPDEIEWSSGLHGKRYVLYYRFKYREVIGTDTTDKAILRLVGERVSTSTSGGQGQAAVINGQDFFSALPNLIAEDPNVSARIFDYVDLVWDVANEDLHVYMQLNEPVTGIVENRPPFTNVDNNGLGIVVSRTTKTIANKKLRDESLQELVSGQYTLNLKFCSPDHVGAPLGCNQ